MNQELIRTAINGALVSRGKNKGMLKSKCPPASTHEASAWQALQPNPFKISVSTIMMFSPIQKAIFEELTNTGVQAVDQDKKALEAVGAW